MYLFSFIIAQLRASDHNEATLSEQTRLPGLVDFRVSRGHRSDETTNKPFARVEECGHIILRCTASEGAIDWWRQPRLGDSLPPVAQEEATRRDDRQASA